MHRTIIGYHQDEEGDWVASLNCGHRQHVRHKPPFFERPWTQTAAGREERKKSPLECPLCDRLEMPEGLIPFHRTPLLKNDTIPPNLLSDHKTKAGVWGRIVVVSGTMRYIVEEPVSEAFELTDEKPGIVAPEIPHRIEPIGETHFYVQLYRLE